MDDMICVFMYFANYKSWLKGGSNSKGPIDSSKHP